jgi:hypothetical protein
MRFRWPRSNRIRIASAVAIALTVGLAAALLSVRPWSDHQAGPPFARNRTHQSRARAATTSTEQATTTTSTLPPPAAGFVPDRVTAIGDSVMLDYQIPLETDIPGVDVDAAVSRQWETGESILAGLKSEGQLGAEVIVALGSNGPISATDFDDMMSTLQGASRIVFVNIHVDRPWQDPNNAVLAQGAARYPRVVIADWAALADKNPQWFGSDGTHLAIDGPGADALAALIAMALLHG